MQCLIENWSLWFPSNLCITAALGSEDARRGSPEALTGIASIDLGSNWKSDRRSIEPRMLKVTPGSLLLTSSIECEYPPHLLAVGCFVLGEVLGL